MRDALSSSRFRSRFLPAGPNPSCARNSGGARQPSIPGAGPACRDCVSVTVPGGWQVIRRSGVRHLPPLGDGTARRHEATATCAVAAPRFAHSPPELAPCKIRPLCCYEIARVRLCSTRSRRMHQTLASREGEFSGRYGGWSPVTRKRRPDQGSIAFVTDSRQMSFGIRLKSVPIR
jgi:hypothetical protein